MKYCCVEACVEMSKEKKRVLFVGLILFIVIGGICYWQLSLDRFKVYDLGMESIVFAEASTLSEKDIAFIMVDGPSPFINYMPAHYLVQTRIAGRLADFSPYSRWDVARWKQADVEIYNILTGELVRVVSILELLESVDEKAIEGYRLDKIPWGTNIFSEDGDIFFSWTIREEPREGLLDIERGSAFLTMNVRSGELEVVSENAPWAWDERRRHKLDERENEFRVQMGIFRRDSFVWVGERDTPQLAVNGIDGRDRGVLIEANAFPGSATIRLPATLLPQESESLYSRFPGLKEYIGQEDLLVRIMLADYPSPEEILEMLMEDGEEISFQGLVISGDRSIDGQEHEIHSFEDFFRLVDRSRWEVEEALE